MNFKTDPNEPIIPADGWANVPTFGLTKREYFASQAMIGLAQDPDMKMKDIVSTSVALADYLIYELNKEK